MEDEADVAVFQYDSAFIDSGVEVSPLSMPLAPAPYSFPGLSRETFRGLPGLLADSLPDRFGNSLIDVWLASKVVRQKASMLLNVFVIWVLGGWEPLSSHLRSDQLRYSTRTSTYPPS